MAESNTNSRLEAFSDGVFAIAITLLIIDIKVPAEEAIGTTGDLWRSLVHLLPSVLAFLLSFVIIFITWVNHHATLKLVDKSSVSFIYANGLLLLAIVIIPFPTALLGEYIFTDHAAPAVVLYSAVNVLQAIAWICLSQAALKPNPLTRSEKATLVMRENNRRGYYAVVVYSTCTAAAFWFPLTIAFLISLMWIGWLILGINIKSE